MLATIASKPVVIVLLDSIGKYTRLGDAQRVKHWLETGEALPAPRSKARRQKQRKAPKPRASACKGRSPVSKRSGD